MRKAEKLFNKWLSKPPTEASAKDVKTLINFYFPDMWSLKGTSHIIIRCKDLARIPGYSSFLTIPIKGGNKIIWGGYIKQLIIAINDLNDLRKNRYIL